MKNKVRITDTKGVDITVHFCDLVGAEYHSAHGEHYLKVTVREVMMGIPYHVTTHVHCESEIEANDMVDFLNEVANPDLKEPVTTISYGR